MEQPGIDRQDEFYLQAFWDLSTCRDYSSLGPIPWQNIVQYAQHQQLETDVTQAFVRIIRQMDTVWIQWNQEEQKKNAEAAKQNLQTAKKTRTK